MQILWLCLVLIHVSTCVNSYGIPNKVQGILSVTGILMSSPLIVKKKDLSKLQYEMIFNGFTTA